MRDRRNGTIRSKRVAKNLLDSPFQIDDRSFSDIIGYIANYLKIINFYDLNNTPNGDWLTILKNDPIIFLVTIINEPTDDLNQKIKNLTKLDVEIEISKLELINSLIKWHSSISSWHDQLENLGELKLAQKINNVLVDVLDFQRRNLMKHQQRIQSTPIKQEGLIKPTKLMAPPEPEESEDLAEIGHNFYRVILHLKQISKHFLENNLLNRSDHKPNNALYIAFALLLKNIQKNTNQLGREHLDFYYKEILGLQNSKGKATKTIVSFDLQPTVQSSKLEKGTLLSAGNPFGGSTELTFETDKPLIVNQVELVEMKTILFNRSPYISIGTKDPTISSIQLKNLKSKGTDVTDRMEWFAFGANKKSVQNTQINSNYTAAIGFIIDSPVLQLKEGTRVIDLQFNLDETSAQKVFWKLINQIKNNTKSNTNTVFDSIFKDGFSISYTSKKGWADFHDYEIFFDENKNSFTIQLKLLGGDPELELSLSIKEKLKWPAIRVFLNEYSPTFLYSFFLGLEIDTIDIDVTVSDVKNLSLYNNLGKIASNISFEPFGAAPEKGSYFLIGNEELFQKQINELEIKIEWEGLPELYGGFDTYYNGYSKEIKSNSFKITKSALSNSYWLPTQVSEEDETFLFQSKACITPEGYKSTQLNQTTIVNFNEFNELGLQKDFNIKTPLVYDTKSRSGFIKLTLTSPDTGFGNSLYFKDYTEIATFNAKNKLQFPLPNRPYSPKSSGVSLSYKASDKLHFKGQVSANENLGEYYHITPFGQEAVIIDQTILKDNLLCQYDAEGYLILGLKGINITTTISMYFQFLRSSTTVQVIPNLLKWEYFHNNHWDEFEEGEIIKDGTNGFTKSGIIEITCPRHKDFYNKTPELYWIRVSTTKGAENFPIIKGVHLNAVEATCTSTDVNTIGKVVPANSISKTVAKTPDIKKIHHPVESGGGVLAEHGNQMYLRISERLRHKQRAVSLWDYERLILENFDIVKVVKCTNLSKNFKPIPGKVKVVVISERWTKEERHYFSQNALNNMQLFLGKHANSLIEIEVVNPSIEYLLVNCIVEFMPEYNGGYYFNLLSNDISDFLSPISKIDNGVGGIGGTIDPTMVGSFIENRPYIKNLKDISIEHIIRTGTNNFVLGVHQPGDKIVTSTPWSIFSPELKHNIIPILNDKSPTALNNGVGNLEIGLDFIVDENYSIDMEDILKNRFLDSAEPEKTTELADDSIFVFKHKT